MSEQFQRVVLDGEGREAGQAKEREGFYAVDDRGNYGGAFLDADALAKAVSDPRYAEGGEYHRVVADLVSRTSPNVLAGHQPKPDDGRAVQAMEIERDWVTSAMADPRYRTSALYRQQVSEHIARSQSNVRHTSLGSPSGCHRVSMNMNDSVSPMGAQSVSVRGEADGSDD